VSLKRKQHGCKGDSKFPPLIEVKCFKIKICVPRIDNKNNNKLKQDKD